MVMTCWPGELNKNSSKQYFCWYCCDAFLDTNLEFQILTQISTSDQMYYSLLLLWINVEIVYMMSLKCQFGYYGKGLHYRRKIWHDNRISIIKLFSNYPLINPSPSHNQSSKATSLSRPHFKCTDYTIILNCPQQERLRSNKATFHCRRSGLIRGCCIFH